MQCSIVPMTLDDAIEHCNDNVKRLTEEGCNLCANEHKQLSEWLTELKERREKDKN